MNYIVEVNYIVEAMAPGSSELLGLFTDKDRLVAALKVLQGFSPSKFEITYVHTVETDRLFSGVEDSVSAEHFIKYQEA